MQVTGFPIDEFGIEMHHGLHRCVFRQMRTIGYSTELTPLINHPSVIIRVRTHPEVRHGYAARDPHKADEKYEKREGDHNPFSKLCGSLHVWRSWEVIFVVGVKEKEEFYFSTVEKVSTYAFLTPYLTPEYCIIHIRTVFL